MPTPYALAIHLSERQQYLLEQMSRKRTSAHHLVQRAQIVLLAAAGGSNTQISQQVNLHRHQVRHWRQQWQDASEQLQRLEAEGVGDEAFTQQIIEVLSDEARSGGPAKFSVEQIIEVVAVACEPPASSGLSISHWTPRELAEEVVRRGIVESISARSVGRFLKRGNPTTPSPPLLAQPQSQKPG